MFDLWEFWRDSVVISTKQMKQIKELLYSKESFEKFDNPSHPLYKEYKDRKLEKAQDLGNNYAIEAVLRIICLTTKK